MKRDDEIKRLVSYAKGLGAKVQFRPYEPYSFAAAEWEVDDVTKDVTITIYIKPFDSKIETVLSLIHEIGHHKDFIHGHRRLHRFKEDIDETSLPYKARKEIYDTEVRGSKYWYEIYRDTGCAFPVDRLFLQMEMDLAIYQIWAETGKVITGPTKKMLWKSLKAKHKRGYE